MIVSVEVKRWAKIDLTPLKFGWSYSQSYHIRDNQAVSQTNEGDAHVPDASSSIWTPEGNVQISYDIVLSSSSLRGGGDMWRLGEAWSNHSTITWSYTDFDTLRTESKYQSTSEGADWYVDADFSGYVIGDDPELPDWQTVGGETWRHFETTIVEVRNSTSKSTTDSSNSHSDLANYTIPTFVLVHATPAVIPFTDGDDYTAIRWIASYAAVLGTFYDAGDGNDTVILPDRTEAEAFGYDFSVGFWGGDGHDDIQGGDGDDIVYGGRGDDRISAGNGRNLLFGGEGNDTFWNGADYALYDGGLGSRDIAIFGDFSYMNDVNLSTGHIEGRVGTYDIVGVEYLQFFDRTIQVADTTDVGMDGLADIIVLNRKSQNVEILNGISPDATITVAGRSHQTLLAAADLNGDGRDDLVFQSQSGWLSYRSATGENVNIGFQNTSKLVAIADLDGNGINGLVFATQSGWLHYATGSSASGNLGARNGQLLVGVGDLDGDGRDDLIFQNESSGWLSYAPSGTGNVNIGNRTGQSLVAIADMDGDGSDDLLFQNSETGWISYRDAFGTNVDIGPRSGQQLIGTGDFDGDSQVELLFKSLGGWLSIASGNQNHDIGRIGERTVAAIDDYDGDGRDDLLMQFVGGQLEIWHSADPTHVTPIGTAAGPFLLGDHGLGIGDDMLIA